MDGALRRGRGSVELGFGMEGVLRSIDAMVRPAQIGVFIQKRAAGKRPRPQLSENAASENWRQVSGYVRVGACSRGRDADTVGIEHVTADGIDGGFTEYDSR